MSAPYNFDEWRQMARALLRENCAPENAHWQVEGQGGLFDAPASSLPAGGKPISIPKEFIALAETIACHRDPERWALLYAALWRLTHGEKYLLAMATDSLMRRLRMMEKAVRRDAHKAKAFVRFRLTQDEQGDHYIAWHRPDHGILPIVAPFFQRRFTVMRWTILTPDAAVGWDGTALHWGPGVPEAEAPDEDKLEDVWRAYYRAIFNPARIKLDAMRREMPARHWATLPETRIIPDLLAEAPSRVAAMIAHQEGLARSAADFLPDDRSLPALRQAASVCEGCTLYQKASCTVFGEGAAQAKIMLVGEQPGDEEDKASRPFIGPAGQMLNRALQEAGLNRDDLYLTNAVKHFKFDWRNNRREHVTANRHEINACNAWLLAEIAAVRPQKIVMLGVTAGRSLLGPGFSLKATRGVWHAGPDGTRLRASYHPAAILRAGNEAERQRLYDALVDDLRQAGSG